MKAAGVLYKGTYYTAEQLERSRQARALAYPEQRMNDLAGELSFLAERGQGATAEHQRLIDEYERLRQQVYP